MNPGHPAAYTEYKQKTKERQSRHTMRQRMEFDTERSSFPFLCQADFAEDYHSVELMCISGD